MYHALNLTVNGIRFTATAYVVSRGSSRVLDRVTTDDPAALDAAALLETTALSLDDVLFVVAEYLALTGRHAVGTACGSVAIDCVVMDPDRYAADLNGRSYSVKLIDIHSNTHVVDVGASNGLVAMMQAATCIGVPVRSSVSQPIIEA